MEATGQGQLDVRTTIVVEREATARSRLTNAVRVYVCVCVYVRESRKPRSLVGGEAWKPSEALHCWARRSWRRARTQWRAAATLLRCPRLTRCQRRLGRTSRQERIKLRDHVICRQHVGQFGRGYARATVIFVSESNDSANGECKGVSLSVSHFDSGLQRTARNATIHHRTVSEEAAL